MDGGHNQGRVMQNGQSGAVVVGREAPRHRADAVLQLHRAVCGGSSPADDSAVRGISVDPEMMRHFGRGSSERPVSARS